MYENLVIHSFIVLFYAPSFIESHYGQNAKILLRQLEAISKKIAKREQTSSF